jgi:hypothetical protein
MIRTRVHTGLKRAKDQIKRDGHFITKHGEVRKRLSRPNADPDKLRKARAALAKGIASSRPPSRLALGLAQWPSSRLRWRRRTSLLPR